MSQTPGRANSPSTLPEPALSSLGCRPEPILQDLLAEGLSVEVPVTGTSMSPFIRSGDTITLAPIGRHVSRRGDIVGFPRPDGRLVVHRVIALRDGRVLTRGDAATDEDGWIDAQAITCRVEGIERRSRRLSLGLGIERTIVAALSRAGLLVSLLRPFRWLGRQRS